MNYTKPHSLRLHLFTTRAQTGHVWTDVVCNLQTKGRTLQHAQTPLENGCSKNTVRSTRSSSIAHLVVGWDTLLGASDSWDPYEPAPTISSIISTAPRDAAWHQILSTPRSLVPSLIMIHRPSGRCHKPISATNSTHAPLEAGQQQLINECGYTSSLGRSVVGTWRSRYTCNRRLALRLMEPQRSIHAAAID